MKKMKRFLVALLSCCTAVACVAGISACKKDKGATTENTEQKPSYDINVVMPGDENCAHKWGVIYTLDATCTAEGKELVGCTECGKTDTVKELMADGSVKEYNIIKTIAKLPHNYVDVAEKEATCTEDGHDAYQVCADCGDETTHTSYTATGHKFTFMNDNGTKHNTDDDYLDYNYHGGEPETCSKDGWTAYNYCSECLKRELAKDENQDKIATLILKENKTYAQAEALVEEELLLDDAKVAKFGKETIKAAHKADADKVSFITTWVSASAATDKFVLASVKADNTEVSATNVCGVDGFKDFKVCNAAECQAEIKKIITALGATYTPEDVVAAVKANEKIAYTEIETIANARADHNVTLHEGYDATCDTAGMETWSECTNANCGAKWYADNDTNTVIAALGCAWNNGTAVVPAVAGGYPQYHCADIKCVRCSDVLDTLKHEIKNGGTKTATCTENGWSAKTYCANCDYETITLVNALGHNWTPVNSATYSAATCTVGALASSTDDTRFVCYQCGENGGIGAYGIKNGATTINTVVATSGFWTTNPLGHQVRTDYVAATCVAPAQNTQCARGCGEAYVACTAEQSLAHGKHTFSGSFVKVGAGANGADLTVYGKAPTCTTTGICTVCKNEAIPAYSNNHVLNTTDCKLTTVYEAKAPTCVSTGYYKTYYCSACGKYAIEKTAGTLTWKVTAYTDNTNAANNIERDVTTADAVITAISHSYTVVVPAVQPTCTDVGYTSYNTCNYCGAEQPGMKREIAKVAHAGTNSAYCRYLCDKAYVVSDAGALGVAGTAWVDANNNGAYDAGETINAGYKLAGCGTVLKNDSYNALHNFDDGDCILCEKKEN